MTANKKWLQPNLETEAEKARRRQMAKENSIQGTVERLEEIQAKRTASTQPAQASASSPLPRQQRIDPKAITERPEPVPISEYGYEPQVLHQAQTQQADLESSAAADQPDSRLLEIAKSWVWLTERDREEMVYLLRVKVHLNKKAAG